jgi:hypothetical protein
MRALSYFQKMDAQNLGEGHHFISRFQFSHKYRRNLGVEKVGGNGELPIVVAAPVSANPSWRNNYWLSVHHNM